jgi:hypothetical protein
MPKNKEDVVSDAFDTIRELIEFHVSLTAMTAATTQTTREGVTNVLDKLEEHILNILNTFDFTPDEQD